MQQELTVLIRSYTEDTHILQRCIDAIMHQDYDSFEVVVVLSPTEEDNINLLEQIEQHTIGLRHIVLPKSVRSISTEQLMLTLGIRSANTEWVVVTQSDSLPVSDQWLATISHYTENETDVVVGFTRRSNDNFAHIWRQTTDFRNTNLFHPYHSDIRNIALRKSTFISNGGTAAFTMLKEGALQLYANSVKGRCMLDMPCAVVAQEKIQRFGNDMDGVVWMETRRHIQYKWRYRVAMFLNILKHQMMFWASVAATMYFLVSDLPAEVFVRNGIDKSYMPALSYTFTAMPLLIYIIFVITTTLHFNKKTLHTYGYKYGVTVCPQKLLFPYVWIINSIDYAFINRKVFYK